MFETLRVSAACTVSLALLAAANVAVAADETFTAQASITTAAGSSASAPVTVVVRRWANGMERANLIDAVKSNGTSGAWAALKTRDDAGSIQLGGRQPIPIKYAYSRPSETGRLITLVAVEPLYFIGAGAPDAKSKIGHDLAVVLLDLDASGLGHGELAPAATVRVDAQQAIVTEDYGAEVVRLSKVARR